MPPNGGFFIFWGVAAQYGMTFARIRLYAAAYTPHTMSARIGQKYPLRHGVCARDVLFTRRRFRRFQLFFVRPDTYLTMLFPLASVPTVIFARYLPSFCFAILLPLSSICFIIGGKRFLISRSFSFVPHGCSRAEFL